MHAAFASDLLMNRPGSDIRYIDRMNAFKEAQTGENAAAAAVVMTPGEKIFDAVMKGSQGSIINLVKEGLDAGIVPDDIIQKHLITAIQKVGVLFEEKKYYLPQLIASAETMEKAITYLEPMLIKDDAEEKATIIMATVEGDIHDIGKNIVKVLLENYGYTVIDLGKDVPCQAVVDAAIEHQVKLVGLSALMTTTLGSMEETIRLLHEQYPSCQTVVGGAVLTPDYAKQIHATFYAKDAKDTVDVAKQVVG